MSHLRHFEPCVKLSDTSCSMSSQFYRLLLRTPMPHITHDACIRGPPCTFQRRQWRRPQMFEQARSRPMVRLGCSLHQCCHSGLRMQAGRQYLPAPPIGTEEAPLRQGIGLRNGQRTYSVLLAVRKMYMLRIRPGNMLQLSVHREWALLALPPSSVAPRRRKATLSQARA